jgi:hypothetical protein
MKFLLVLLLASIASAKDVYHIRRLSEQDILQTYTQLLRDACHYADRDWKTSGAAAGYWGDGVSIGNGGIRTIAGMVLACGTELKYDDSLSDSERHDLFTKATAAIRFVTSTHVTGSQKCTDGKHWGATTKSAPESWQSGMWTGTLACGAWLLWDKLDPELQQAVERVVAAENDFLTDVKPRNGLWDDTKAEENGWEVPTLVLGELMFPSHPHAVAWRATALKYMMNTLCTEADTHDTNMVDGRPTNQWVGGANLQPDFTLENHKIFHPSYVGCSSYFLTQAALYYTYAGKPVPSAATHHLADTWRMFQTILLPWGEAAYPQGMDWELHGLPFLNLFAALATRDHDPFAARMEQSSLQNLRGWQLMCGGDLTLPGSRWGIVRHSINAEQASYGLLAHKVYGPAAEELTARAAADEEQGVHEYPFVQIISHRTREKFVSFSWKNRIMGLVAPLGEGHEGSPEFAVPIVNGIVGSFELAPRGDETLKVVDHSWKKTADGFETSGTLLLNGGRLKQTLRLISVGSQTVVYEDRVTALADVTVKSERGVPIGIENDQLTGGTRVLSDQNGQTNLDWQKPRPAIAISGKWANVDGRIGIVVAAGSGLAYMQASRYSPGISVYSDILCGSYSDRQRQFKAGEEVAHRVAILAVETTPEQTSALTGSCRIDTRPDGRTLHFRDRNAKDIEVQLLDVGAPRVPGR